MSKEFDCNCNCDVFRALQPGSLVKVILKDSSKSIIFTFTSIIGNTILGTTLNGRFISIDCRCICEICFILSPPGPPTPCTPMITLFANNITCGGTISGSVTCSGVTVPGAVVNFTSNSPLVTFSPASTTTDANGSFMNVSVTVPANTTAQNVTITATTVVNGTTVSDTETISVTCPENPCLNPVIAFTNVPTSFSCTSPITGTVTCNGAPVANALVNFSSTPDLVTFVPNPATTNAAGQFTTTASVPTGTTAQNVTITASTTVNGVNATQTTPSISVSCPGVACPCKVRLNTEDSPATAAVTSSAGSASLVGTIGIDAVECFTDATMCNPAVDEFRIDFRSGNTTINFVMGRRISLSCTNGTQATLVGTARAAGNFFPPMTTFTVTITISIVGSTANWTVTASDGGMNNFTTTFSDTRTPETFIGGCGDTP